MGALYSVLISVTAQPQTETFFCNCELRTQLSSILEFSSVAPGLFSYNCICNLCVHLVSNACLSYLFVNCIRVRPSPQPLLNKNTEQSGEQCVGCVWVYVFTLSRIPQPLPVICNPIVKNLSSHVVKIHLCHFFLSKEVVKLQLPTCIMLSSQGNHSAIWRQLYFL